ncbi:MAG TPA: DUF3592 domain-containing protein [Thermoanaerobaculia bacterium]|nr:DUF3592 domain-containing protein [Thermoanaerobaculia bacterium]
MNLHFLGFLVFLAGILVLLYGSGLFVAKLGFVRRAGSTVGTVTRRVVRGRSRFFWQPACYHPVILFHTPEGEQVVFQSPEPMAEIRCRVGTELAVLYDGVDPGRATIAGRHWYDVFMTCYLGVLVSAAGVVLTGGLQHLIR